MNELSKASNLVNCLKNTCDPGALYSSGVEKSGSEKFKQKKQNLTNVLAHLCA